MNWGNKIALVIIVFVGIMMGMVFVAFKQTNEMIDDNYYDKEIKYHSKIDASQSLRNFTTADIVTTSQNGVMIQIPSALCTQFSNGTIELLRSSDQSKDLNAGFTPDKNGQFLLSNEKLASGKYTARIAWKNDNKDYYKEQTIFIKK